MGENPDLVHPSNNLSDFFSHRYDILPHFVFSTAPGLPPTSLPATTGGFRTYLNANVASSRQMTPASGYNNRERVKKAQPSSYWMLKFIAKA